MKELLYLKDDQLKDLIEKLFIGYRETFSDSKKILNKYAIGLAHQKVIHLLSMYEGISITELLKRLKVTKQSLNRVLKDLINLEIIIFKKDEQRYLENADEDGNVSINYRFISQQTVKKGDIIKLGSALLQYHEV